MALFMKMGDITGEATTQGVEEWIELASYSFGASLGVDPSKTGPKRIDGRSECHDISVSKEVDSASSAIASKLLQGQVIPEVIIKSDKTSDGIAGGMLITLKDVLVTGWNIHAMGEGSNTSEDITLNWVEINVEYKTTDPRTGAERGTSPFTFNRETGVA